MKAALVALVAAAVIGVAGAAVAHALVGRAAPLALPELHGQMTWRPGTRVAPADVPRGRTAALVLLAPRCRDCMAELRYTLAQLPARLRPTVVRRTATGRSILLLVDKSGNVRTGYAFPFQPVFVDGDLRTLAR
jgi:hypothetical protein